MRAKAKSEQTFSFPTAIEQEAANTKNLTVRYKTQTAAKSNEILTLSEEGLVHRIKRDLRSAPNSFAYVSEYHISLLAREQEGSESSLSSIYDADHERETDRATPFDSDPGSTNATMRPWWDFDGQGSSITEQLLHALTDVQRLIRNEWKPFGLRHLHDFEAYFTGGKGIRLLLKGQLPREKAVLQCELMRTWCEERNEQYKSLDTGIYRYSMNGGFVRGPGSQHPKTGLFSVMLTSEELNLDGKGLSPVAAVNQILARAQMSPTEALKVRSKLDPLDFLGLKQKPSKELQFFLKSLHDNIRDLRWIHQFDHKEQSLRSVNFQALAEVEGLEIKNVLYDGKVATLRKCPCCGHNTARVTSGGTLYCFRTSCQASEDGGGLKLSEWAHIEHPEEIIQLKAPVIEEQQKPIEIPEIRDVLHEQRIEFFERRVRSILTRASMGTGKSTIMQDGTVEIVQQANLSVLAVPEHGLLQEKKQELLNEAEGRQLTIALLDWKGRGAKDGEFPMCLMLERVNKAVHYHMPIGQTACSKCPARTRCLYQKQFLKLTDLSKELEESGQGFVLLMTHHALWALLKQGMIKPDFVIIDEDPSGAATKEQQIKASLLEAPFEEPQELEADLKEAYQPARELLQTFVDKSRELHQKAHDRERRKARQKGKKWVPRIDRRVPHEALVKLLLELDPKAPMLFEQALEAIREIHPQWRGLERKEQERWLKLLDAPLRLVPLFEALSYLLNAEEDPEKGRERGFCVELSFPFETQEGGNVKGKRQKLKGGTFHIVEMNALDYDGPLMGLDGTGESLPWTAMLGREDLKTLRLESPLHPESWVDWIELGTYQSVLLREKKAYIDKYLIPRVRHELENNKRVLISTWLKEGPNGSYEGLVRERLELAGLPVDGQKLEVITFFGKRGHNKWRNWEVGILWGMPIENPDALRMRAEALSQLVPLENREELKKQLTYQSSAGQALQDLNRVGANLGAKQWVIYASSSYLPIAEHLERVTAPGQFRKLSGRSKEAVEPERLKRQEDLVQKIAEIGFHCSRLTAALLGVDPVGRLALMDLGLLQPGDLPMNLGAQSLDQISRVKREMQPNGDRVLYRDLVQAYSAKVFRKFIGRREEQRLSARLTTLTGWNPQAYSEVTIREDNGTHRPYHVLGDADLGREYLKLCSILEGKISHQSQYLTLSFEPCEISDSPSLLVALESLMMPWFADDDEGLDWCKDDQWLWWLNMSLALLSQGIPNQDLEPQAVDGAPISRGPP
ncbi:MAG: hypothetical protein AAFQ83_19155 [Bacteroidota bacterium]